MARDYFDESKKKKKKETQQVQKVAKSPSVKNVNNRASKSTFMGGGSAVRNTQKNVSKSTTTNRSFSSNNQPVKRQPTSRTNSARVTAAQRQKMGLDDQFTAEERQSWRERSQARAQQARIKKMGLAPEDQASEAQKRAIRNTPKLIGKALKDTGSEYLQTLNDVTARTAANKNGTKAKAMKMGIEEGTQQYKELEEERRKTVEKAKQDNQSLYQKMKTRQAEWDEKTKDAKGLEKAYYGAVESGTGMAADTAVGLLTGTGQIGALASMGMRTYGSSANQAREEGATEAEAGWYGLSQAVKEMGTEMIGGGGLAKVAYGKGALGLGDIATNTLIRNLKGQKADLAHMGVRLLGDVAEENIEELAGWTLDPWIKELTYGRNVRQRDAQTAMRDRSNALRAEIENDDDARAAAAYLSSDDFLNQTMQDYIASGLKKEDAAEVAERMRDYLTASLTGDTDSMQKIEDEVSRKVAKSHNVFKDYSFKELKETFEATSLLVAATGLPANISTMNRGNLVKEQLGDEGVRALANTAIDFEDSTMSTKAEAMKARLDSGKELTGTQAYELMSGMQEQVRKDTEREQSSRRMAAKAIENDNLLTPYRQNQNGGIDLDAFTEAAYRESANKASAAIDALTKEGKQSITDTEKADGSKAIAGFQTGVFTVDDANALNYSNTTVRAAFENVTGVNLGQYIVRNKKGEVDIPATNTKTKDALFAMAADNLVKTSQADTKNWMDTAKGEVVTQISARMGARGSEVLQMALDDVDERDRSKYMMTANATDMLYQAARNMGTEWESISTEATRMFPGISETKLKAMYDAGLEDRQMANDKMRGRQVRIGNALSEMGEQETATGKVFIDSAVPPKGSVIRTFTEIAKNLGADIHFVDAIYDTNDDPIEGANGSYDPKTNTFYLNVATGVEKNIGYIFMHETTHYLKRFAPEQYQALENLVREKWFAFNPSQMQDAIARKIEAYKRATKGQQILTEEEALEEIIADASHDFINDPEFAKQVAEEDMGLAKAVLDSIRNAMRMLRRIFASGSIEDDTHMNSLFRELDIMTEAERLWLDAYKTAVRNSSIAAINAWQDEANRHSITEGKKSNSAAAKYERGEKLSHSKFNSFYSAHKLNFGRADESNMTEVIENIKDNGFISTTAISNVLPASINDYIDPNRMNDTQARYGARKGDTVMLVPNKFVDLDSDIIKNGFKPRDYEIVTVERDFQPYYELYSKAYDESQTKFSISDDLAAFNDYIMNRKESSARWTDDRIDSLIKEYGASNPDYSQAYAVLMDPRDFLKLTLADVKLEKWNRYAKEEEPEEIRDLPYAEANAYKEANPRNGIVMDGMAEAVHKLDEEELRNNEQTPFLTIYSKDGTKVQGHEGRHRMRALMEAGIKSVPVVIRDTDTKYSKVPMESMTLSSQDFGYDPINNGATVTIKGLVPIKESNRDELIQKFGGEAQVRYSLPETDNEGKALTQDQREFFRDVAPELLDDNGNIKRYFHGTARADRVGYYFNPERATSGPMAYFTDNRDIAANYSRDKADTSLAYEGEDVNDYHNQFVVDVDGEEVRLEDYWYQLPASKKLEYREKAGHITYDYDGEDDTALIIDENVNNGNGGYGADPYLVRQARGNVFRMLIDAWLDSGDFFNEEERFLEVMDLLGMEGVRYKDPNYRDEKVYEVYLNVTNPLVTTDLDEEFAADVEDWLDATDLDYYARESASADMWDKNDRDPYDWLDALRDDIENGTTHVWTSIPDVITDFLKEQGYDGIVDQGGKYHEAGHQVVIPFEPNQIKLTTNEHPTDDVDIRYSIAETDSEGNFLSDGQRRYFNNSLAVDEQGRLVPVYHVTPIGGFTVFDPSYSFDETSISFSDSLDFALNYSSDDGNPDDWETAAATRLGDVEAEDDLIGHYKVYLNMENPLILEGDYLAEMDIYEWPIYAKANGYDGVIYRDFDDGADIYQVFSSNQIKDTRNVNPTENPDIRYSVTEDEAKSQIAYNDAMDNSYELLTYYEQQLGKVNPETYDVTKAFKEEDVVKFLDALKAEDAVPSDDAVFEEDRVRRARSKEDFFSNVNAKWNDRWTTEGEVLKISSVKRDITNLVKGAMANSDSDAQYRNEIVRKTLLDARIAYQLMKQDRTELASYLLYHSAQRMIDGLEFIRDDTAFQEYKGIRDFLRGYRINAPEEYWHNVEFNDFRKEYYGRLRIGKGNNNIESVYQDLADRWPHLFNESEREKAGLGDSVEDLLQHIGVVVDSNVTPFMEAYSSEEAASLTFDLADQLYEIIANGDRVVSLADSYKERFDAKTKALKQRHAEAILRERKIREEGIKKERKNFREYKERQKEKALHTKNFESIKRNYDELTKRLLTNTKDKHIPEQYKRELAGLLKAFDFQTVGSKNREERTGYKAKNTIKLEAMRTALEDIENNSQLFHINDSITDIMKDLLGLDDSVANKESIEGKTLDELSASELKKVDNLLAALLHEFNNYEKVRIGVKKQQAADIGHAQNNISLEHAEMFGAGKDYQNTPGWVDKILNLDEMTAAYLFKRIDPNKEGLGLMYGEIRKSFDKYVRNQNQLNDWMEDIVGKYHNKGILWNKYGSGELTNWRSDNYAQNFKLENGHTIRLTIAQMMSVACLNNRKQAKEHMLGNGVVVSPVTFNAKMLSDLKKKVNKALPERLTEADINNIITALTPEQRQVANKLQELMATKMAEWGNEASMNVIGIRLFEDPDYFPIRSDRGGLTKDLDPNQFEQAIRNFGFTKAVKPGAKNAIMIDDIFDVVTEHCNNMNLYNSYTEAMNDFMKVYNYREAREEGEYTVEQALSHAFSQKAPTFIMQFMRDLNGNVSRRASGIEDAYNSLLGNAKKAAVFANLRVAAQQPTAITRAFAVIDPKYLKGIKIEQGAMEEMFEHCPIALWKSWGYYDINMGKSIEDIMMNNGRWLEDKATDLYGALDNVTWTAIWQMVKAEMKDTHPDVKIGSDEYFELCNERMSEIVDLTQVVDSPMHRSHAMRDKGFLKKTATAFMAEPTLTFNMIRDGWISAREEWQKGDKSKASAIAGRTIAVALLQAATVAGAAAIVDALRKKRPDKDDDEDGFLHLWWVNALENFKSELQLWNKIYFIKDIASIFDGWENSNLALQGIQKFALGYRQLTGAPYARSNAAWYENMADGIGYMWGIPVKTMRTGLSNAMNALGLTSPLIDAMKENLDEMAADNSSDTDKSGFIGGLLSDDSSGMFGKLLTTSTKETEADEAEEETEETVPTRESLPDNLTDEEKDEIIKAAERRAKKASSSEEQEKRDYDKMMYDALKAASGYEGEKYNKKIWESVSEGYTERLAHGDYFYIDQMRKVVEDAGGDVEYFDQRVFEKTKSEFKKKMVSDLSPEDSWNMEKQKHYLTTHGMTDEQLSSEIVYKSDMAKDLKVAFRINDEEAIKETSDALALAGLTRQDFERIYKNRNRIDLTKYDGKYKDRLKSTGNFIWPTDGVITSHFGYRNAPTAGASSNHPAIDIGAPMGTEVVAADGGVVIYAGTNGGYGNSVGIKHDNGMVTYYNHLSAWNVNVGDSVAQGQPIANVGSTGVSTGPHLDFKILDANGEPVDPEVYLENKRS